MAGLIFGIASIAARKFLPGVKRFTRFGYQSCQRGRVPIQALPCPREQ
jgi:hypothetical protein